MRRVAIVLFVALFAALPTTSRAQYNDTDQQNPNEYHDEDSSPLALIADIFYPVGYGLEWLVARPLHYLSTDSAVAPAYRPVGGRDMSPPPIVPIIPDNTLESADSSTTTPQDWSPTHAPVTTNATVIKPSAPPAAASSPSGSQPALH